MKFETAADAAQWNVHFRLDGHQWTIEESIPDLVTGLVHFLAKTGTISLPDLIADIDDALKFDLDLGDSARLLLDKLAARLEAFEDDLTGVGRIRPIFELVLPN